MNIIRGLLSQLASPVISLPGKKIHYFWALGLLCALLTTTLYIGLIAWFDNTNLGTTNGLWKAPVVSAAEHGTTYPVDSGEILYANLYGHLANLIPDSALEYGTPATEVTFRKMAILNALFGGLASGFVFLLALRFANSRVIAASVSLIHAGAGFVLLNSINSEDIIPAYACVLGALVFFFEFLNRGGALRFVSSAAMLALATLLHWTVMVPALAGIAIVFLLLIRERRLFFWLGVAWFLAFCISAQLLVLIGAQRLHIPIWVVILPGKADAGGWVGLSAIKLWYLVVGVGNYFSGAGNYGDFRTPFRDPSSLNSMIVSWLLLAIGVGACIASFVKGKNLAQRLLAAFALSIFVIGEAGAFYSQPQDPQMQVEPMFVVIAGLILIASSPALIALSRAALPLALTIIAIANGSWNLHLLSAGRGQDSKALHAIQEQDALFPRTKTVIVCLGFEGWTTWQYIALWNGDSEAWMKRSFHLARPFTTNRGISGEAAANLMIHQIDDAFSNGLRVVSDALWIGTEKAAADSLTTVTTEADARRYVAILRNHYRTGARWNTELGPFVEVLPNSSANSDGRAIAR